MPCKKEGCDQPIRYIKLQLCDKHYKQQWRAQRSEFEAPGCSVEDCMYPHEARGYCQHHYDKWRLHGDPLAITRKDPSKVEEVDGCLHVHLGGEVADGAVTICDVADRALVEGKSWWLVGGYVAGKVEGKRALLHRLLLGLEPGDSRQCDHINGDPLDNRRENLRAVTYEQNMQNKKPWGESGQRNVYYDAKKGLYRVIVTCRGKRHYGGRHKKLEDARAAAQALREELFTHANEDRAAVTDA